MDVMEFKGKTKEDAITAASVELGVTSDKLNYEVVDEGSAGFLGIFNVKPAVIRVTLKKSLVERTQEFCDELFAAMRVETVVSIQFHEEDNVMNIELSGPDCIVISHDIPLLARALEKGARAMDDRGGVYSSENIRVRLGERDVNSILREMKVFEDRSRPFDNKQLEAFANCLDRMLINHT